jgi:hypothetical protein
VKSEEFEHFIINGEEVKFKRYDYFVLAKTKERVKVIARKQFEFGSYGFTNRYRLKSKIKRNSFSLSVHNNNWHQNLLF